MRLTKFIALIPINSEYSVPSSESCLFLRRALSALSRVTSRSIAPIRFADEPSPPRYALSLSAFSFSAQLLRKFACSEAHALLQVQSESES